MKKLFCVGLLLLLMLGLSSCGKHVVTEYTAEVVEASYTGRYSVRRYVIAIDGTTDRIEISESNIVNNIVLLEKDRISVIDDYCPIDGFSTYVINRIGE